MRFSGYFVAWNLSPIKSPVSNYRLVTVRRMSVGYVRQFGGVSLWKLMEKYINTDNFNVE